MLTCDIIYCNWCGGIPKQHHSSLYYTLSLDLSLTPKQSDAFHSQWPMFWPYDQKKQHGGLERTWMEPPVEWVCAWWSDFLMRPRIRTWLMPSGCEVGPRWSSQRAIPTACLCVRTMRCRRRLWASVLPVCGGRDLGFLSSTCQPGVVH